jgi:two-component system LytT family response regulator
MKTAIIVEDEMNARALLRRYLEKYCETEVIGEVESVSDGVDMVLEKKPDMVFLDISLPDHNGFELIRRLQPVEFEVIFVTAYDQYALQALKLSAVDYLLKPVDISELRQSVQKARERIDYKRSNENLLVLLENLKQPESRRIAIPDGHSYVYEDVANIIRLRAQGRYTEIYTVANKKYTVTRNLGEFDKMLSQYKFLRVHHSHLVNPQHISSFEKQDGGFLIMKDKSSVEVSRKNKEALMNFLKKN